ncbi:hypothetical protein NPIL_188121 [Nephila pilipes]|uniref:Uncharacterized protein n=1 Tax=Nephila pilipes TaxID=299642 RepID=A0A8X6R6P0_NEPPI|nr:hypothetical protein NPIL_188121 [Nephila pilipes]
MKKKIKAPSEIPADQVEHKGRIKFIKEGWMRTRIGHKLPHFAVITCHPSPLLLKVVNKQKENQKEPLKTHHSPQSVVCAEEVPRPPFAHAHWMVMIKGDPHTL